MKITIKRPKLPRLSKLNNPQDILSRLIELANSRVAIYLAIFVFLIGANVFSQQFFLRLDLTAGGQFTLSNITREVASTLESPYTIRVYASENLPPELGVVEQNTRDLLAEYARFAGSNLKIDYVDNSNPDFRQQATNAGMQELQFSQLSQDSIQLAAGFLGLVIEDGEGNNFETLSLIDQSTNLEYELTAALSSSERDTTELKKIGFLAGNGERDLLGELSILTDSLQGQFATETVSVSDGSPLDPEDYPIVAIVGPTLEFSERTQFELDQYLLRGGNLIVLADLYTLVPSAQTADLNRSETNLPDFLINYGIGLEDNILLDQNNLAIPNTRVPFPYWILTEGSNINSELPPLSRIQSLAFFWANQIRPAGTLSDETNYEYLARTTDKAWQTRLAEGQDSITVDLEPITPGPAEQFDLAAVVTGKQVSAFVGQQVPEIEGDVETDPRAETDIERVDEAVNAGSLMVVGDAEFVTNNFISGSEQNAIFIQNMIDWLVGDEGLTEIRSKNIQTRTLQATTEAEKNTIKVAVVVVPLAFTLVTGAGFNLWRKRRKSIL